MKNFFQKEKKTVTFLYILGLFGMFSILLLIFISKKEPEQKINEQTYKNITTSWTLDKKGTQSVDVTKLGKYIDVKSGVLSVYYQLPKMNADVSLVYRSKDVYTRVLVDKEVIYETEVYESKFYNKSPGNLWNVVNVNSKYSGKCLELQIIMVYDTNAITVEPLLFGDKADIILGLFADNMLGIVISLLLILLGIVLLVVDALPSYGRAKKHHGLFWVGIYAVLTGVWSLIETNVVQFCVDDMRILQLIDNMIMMLYIIPLVMYLHTEYEILKNKWMRILAYIGIGYIVLCVIMQYIGITDLHYMLNGGFNIMAITVFAMCICLIKKLFKLKEENRPRLNCVLMILGLFAISASNIFQAIRTPRMESMDRAEFIRVGMLVLCICFAIGSQVETYKVVEQGLKYDLISKLAYSDGLTGLGNRTAYLEQLEAYESNQKKITQLGIVYLDVNNLKTVNDYQGHEFGDDLIKCAAKVIDDSFGQFGKSYRIGGDEFCVLIADVDAEAMYEKGLSVFKHLIDKENTTGLNRFPVQIAHGFVVCKEFTKEKIEERIKIADSRMYQNKMELKRTDVAGKYKA